MVQRTRINPVLILGERVSSNQGALTALGLNRIIRAQCRRYLT